MRLPHMKNVTYIGPPCLTSLVLGLLLQSTLLHGCTVMCPFISTAVLRSACICLLLMLLLLFVITCLIITVARVQPMNGYESL